AVEECLRAEPRDAELGKARLVEDADARANSAALLADRVEPVAAPERVLVARAVTGEPEGPLPAEALAENRAARGEPLVDWIGLERPARGQLLLGVVYRVLALVDLGRLRHEKGARVRVVAE